jgi:hypothetical protein
MWIQEQEVPKVVILSEGRDMQVFQFCIDSEKTESLRQRYSGYIDQYCLSGSGYNVEVWVYSSMTNFIFYQEEKPVYQYWVKGRITSEGIQGHLPF